MEIEKSQDIITSVPDLRSLFYLAADNAACIYLKRKLSAGESDLIATGILDGDVEGIRVTKGDQRIITVYGRSAGPERIDACGSLPNNRLRLRNIIVGLFNEIESGKTSGQDGTPDGRS